MSLNFGHDASFSYFENGTLIEFSELERESGLKHQLGVTSKEIYDFLKRVKIEFDEVDTFGKVS